MDHRINARFQADIERFRVSRYVKRLWRSRLNACRFKVIRDHRNPFDLGLGRSALKGLNGASASASAS